ncbi:methyltransferase domain-containing protein [Candidatus Dojkabacteria bacterium]|nr:methyltransferase domain-containing protein [Candidatus Dojkabacteria bacterium]
MKSNDKKTWNNIADEYNRSVGETGDLYHKTYLNPIIKELLGNIRKKEILDLACGQGYFSRWLAQQGAIVTGIDIADKLIKIAQDHESKKPLGIKYFIRDSSALEHIKDRKFHFIVSNMAFHDIRTIKDTINECSRVIKKGGNLIFSILNPITDDVIREEAEEQIYNKMKSYRTESVITFNDINPHYHRSIGFYLANLFSAGFLLSGFHEIYTKHRDGKVITDPKMKKYKQEFPPFLIIKCIKEG